jgi:GT2 family glycosyltransferase
MLLDIAAGRAGDRIVPVGKMIACMIRVSVVMPTYRRPELLGRCLDALAAQTLSAQAYEVVIADDAASDATRRQVEAFAAKRSPTVRYVPVTGIHGPAAARNAGWRASQAAVIAFTDDDTVPSPGWLAAGLMVLDADETISALSGSVVVPLPDCPTDYERNEAGLESAEFVTANCFCRREVLEAIGGFDERFTMAWREDSDLHFRLLEHGARLAKATGAIVVHPLRPAPWGVSLKMQRKSLFDALLYQKHPSLYRQRIRRWPPLDYYGILLALLTALVAIVGGYLWIALAALAVWTTLTCRFLSRRLHRTSRAPVHVAEMVVTSSLIPPLSVFWRLYGAIRFRVLFL